MKVNTLSKNAGIAALVNLTFKLKLDDEGEEALYDALEGLLLDAGVKKEDLYQTTNDLIAERARAIYPRDSSRAEAGYPDA